MKQRNDIRNVAIVAHVDHGKTTLVDAMLKQSKIFRDNQDVGTLIMDSNSLEREKGITIMAKNTAVVYRDVKINIIDTPGHADFSGEVERVISMADGCLLLVDAVEGPMPQTKFVLKEALNQHLKIIVVVNKLDRPNARVSEVIRMTQDLFLELATTDEHLDFKVLYGSGRDGYVVEDPDARGGTIAPLFDTILDYVPGPQIEEGPFQMLVSNLDYDSHKGQIAIGRIWRGAVSERETVTRLGANDAATDHEVAEVFTYLGLKRLKVDHVEAGDIAALTGIADVAIGDTLASPDKPEALPRIAISDPTVEMTFGVNTSPFAGKEGRYCTTRQLRERLYRELATNLSLRVEDTDSPDTFVVRGRGELHLAILIETMRREGYEFEISRPEAIVRNIDGKLMEPVEELTIDTSDEFIGVLTESLAKRQARMTDMVNDGQGNVRLVFSIPTKGLLGFRSLFLTATRGEGVMNSVFTAYEPWRGDIAATRSGGVLIASEAGTATAYGLGNAQERGVTFIDPGESVYEGMIFGQTAHNKDIPVNVGKEKKQTNVRSSTKDIAVKLTPPLKMSLEQSIDFINRDELVEITPKNVRLRKKVLNYTMRLREKAALAKVAD